MARSVGAWDVDPNSITHTDTESPKTPWAVLDVICIGSISGAMSGAATHITVPPGVRGYELHAPRGWMGYSLGCEGESVYRI